MANLSDIGAAATINLTSAIIFLVAFAMLRLQPFNDRVYFPKWYLKGTRSSPTHSGSFVSKFVNFDGRTYLRFLSWMPAALRMPEPELIEHAGLDSAVYVRIYLLGLKIFVPITILAFGVLVPVNWTSNSLESTKGLEFSDIDKLSISNVASGSQRFWAHVGMAYVFTFWTFYVLYMEYKRVAHMRHHFLASARRRADQFTVLVRCVPPDPDMDKPTTKTGFWGLWGKTVDAIEYYTAEIEKLSKEPISQNKRYIVKDGKPEMIPTNPIALITSSFFSTKSKAVHIAGTKGK